MDKTVHMQAQTVANFYHAFERNLEIVPVINKIDLHTADPAKVATEIEATFDLPAATTLRCSAKSGEGIEEVLAAIVERIPHPQGDAAAPFRLLLFDAFVDTFRGIVCLVLVHDGTVSKGDKLRTSSTGQVLEVLEVWRAAFRFYLDCPYSETKGLLRTSSTVSILECTHRFLARLCVLMCCQRTGRGID